MADSETSPSSSPLYHEVDPHITMALRIYGVVTGFLVFLALIFCFVKGADDSNMYLLAVNMIMSSIIGAILAWWYRKGIIEADKIGFMIVVGVCIMFQAIISDVYIYHRPTTAASNIILPTPVGNMTSLRPPITK